MSEYHEDTRYGRYVIRLEQDDNCDSPRTDRDNLGTMICWHRRCSMGDATIGDAYGHPVKGVPFFETAQRLADYVSGHSRYKTMDGYDEVLCYLPVYLYEHSGQTVRTTPFGDPWDSGQVGFIFVTKAKVREEWKVKRISPKLRKLVMNNLEGEVKDYDRWLTGDIWGYKIYGPLPDGFDEDKDDIEEYEQDDACWGFYGQEYCLQEAKSAVDYIDKKEQEKAWLQVPMQEVLA
jgi:hypothetical protein